MAEQGFGCMGFSAFYSSARKTTGASAKEVFRSAVESGVTLFNTATFYGPLNEDGYGANLRLLKECLVGQDRSKIQLMVKIGMDTRAPVEATGELNFSSQAEPTEYFAENRKTRHIGTQWINRADEEGLRTDVEYALKEMGVDYIDIIVLCRVSPTVSIEDR